VPTFNPNLYIFAHIKKIIIFSKMSADVAIWSPHDGLRAARKLSSRLIDLRQTILKALSWDRSAVNVFSACHTGGIAAALFDEDAVKQQFDCPVPPKTIIFLRTQEAANLLAYVKHNLAAAIAAAAEFRSYGFNNEAIGTFVDVCPQSACLELILNLAAADIDVYMQLRDSGCDHGKTLLLLKEKKVSQFTVRTFGMNRYEWKVKNIDWSRTSLKTAIKLALCAQHPLFKRVGAFNIEPGNKSTFVAELLCTNPVALVEFDYH
tara:strand:+ start:248 stop:1036 length:789 start_codon:yes stop_codon:yes gene_type:complete